MRELHAINVCSNLYVFKQILILILIFSECNVAGFVNSNGHVERVPYVFLPQRGQIIYPHAEIRFEGKSPALNKN